MVDQLLAGDVFEGETFDGVDLAGRDLSEKELVRCTFRHARLTETIWNGSRLDDCVFDTCDLTRQRGKNLALRGVELRGCKLMGIDWTALAQNPTVKLTECQLRYAAISEANLRLTSFVRCHFEDAAFVEVSLQQAIFDDCELGGALFERCDLRQADFSSSRGLVFDPATNRVKGARISLETAALVATSLGLVVAGFSESR